MNFLVAVKNLPIRVQQDFPDMPSVCIKTLRSQFILDKTSTTPVGGMTVVATLSGAGRWLRLSIAHPSWDNLAAAIPPGFGGNAHNVERDAHIVLR